MVGEIILEEVPTILSIDAVHGNKVTRVHSIAYKLKAHGRHHELDVWIRLSSERHSSETVVSSSKEACVGMVSGRDHLHVSNGSNSVDVLSSESPPPA
jgi:hypothetical protein